MLTAAQRTFPLVSALAVIDFLNNRERANAIWLGLFIVYACLVPGVLSGILDVLKQLAMPVLSLPLFASAGYTAAITVALQRSGLWHTSTLKETLYWYFGTAVILFFSAEKIADDPGVLRDTVVRSVFFLVGLEFIVNLGVFSFVVELLVVPVLFVLSLLVAVSETNPAHAKVYRFFQTCLGILGFLFVALGLRKLIVDFDTVTGSHGWEQLYVPALLTVAYVPFAYALSLYVAYDGLLRRVSFWLKDKPHLIRYARLALIRTCGLNAKKARRFSGQYYSELGQTETKQEIRTLMTRFKASPAQPT